MPENSETKKKSTFHDLLILGKYFKEFKWSLLIACVVIFISNISFVLVGYLNGAALENVTNGNYKLAIMTFLIYFIVEIVSGPFCRIFYYNLSKIQLTISRKIGYDAYCKAMHLPAYAFEELSSGEIINRVTNDTETVIGTIEELINIIARLVSTILIFIFILTQSWIIALEIATFIFIYSFIVRHYTKELKKYHKQRKEENDKFTSLTNESIRGIREIKTLGITNNLFKNTRDLIAKMLDTSTKEYKAGRNFDMFQSALGAILEVSVFITCVILVAHKQMSLTFFIAMTYYVYQYIYVLDSVNKFTRSYEQLMVALNRINEILNNKLYDDVAYGNVELEDVKGTIQFKDVTFNYKNEGPLLKKFNIKFEPNKKIAIVGSSGEGKSTIFNLLTRIFDPISGTITLDGVNIQDLSEESLRKSISIIRQEPFIFNRTILENFKLLDENISLEEVRKCCALAHIDEYIMSLPKAYDTLLGEGGVNLSGGQKQRLSIARTLMRKSKVILFDEATSALDNESQEYIKKTIDELVSNHTVLIVAHRLSTIIDADVIYVIKNGKVFASGTHKHLMDTCKFYQKLYTTEGKTV